MTEKSWYSQKPTVAGLLIRFGNRSWFWGRGTPITPGASTSDAQSSTDSGTWSGVGEWLRRMHAQADRPPSTPNKEL